MINERRPLMYEFPKNTVMYYMFHVFGFIATVIYALIFYRKFKLSIWRTLAFVLTVFPIAYAFMWFQYWVASGFKAWGNNIVRVFIWIPFIGLPFAKLYKIDYHKCIEFLAPIPCIIHGVAHFGCVFEGCCYGYPSNPGIWNPALQEYRFPIQFIEAGVAIIIAILVIMRLHKFGYDGTSKSYAFMLMLFGSTRFILEFFRDNTKEFWGISNLALHALLMLALGIFFFFFPFDKVREAREEERKRNERYAKKKVDKK